jgi:AraC-like DNA-binding protein
MAWSSRRPAAPLDAFVARLWTSARSAPLPHAREWNLPTGGADLVVPLTQAALRRYDAADDHFGRWHAGGVLQGVHEAPTLRDTSTALAVVGAQFRPGALAAFFGAPAHVFTGTSVALETLWPGFAAALQDRLLRGGRLALPAARLDALEAALRARLRPGAAPDRWLAEVRRRLAAGETIGEVQRASGCAPTTFIARYRAACGLAPKRHAALLRLHALLQRGGGAASWAAAASDGGYADQAHLTREFRRFTGFTPGQYRRDATAFASHVICR